MPHGRLHARAHDGYAAVPHVRRRTLRECDRRGYRPLHRMTRRALRRPGAQLLGSRPRRDRLRRRKSGLRRRSGRGWLGDRRPLRQLAGRKKRERVQVSVRVGSEPDAEIHERLGAFDVAGRPNRADDVALGDLRARRHSNRSEMDERDRERSAVRMVTHRPHAAIARRTTRSRSPRSARPTRMGRRCRCRDAGRPRTDRRRRRTASAQAR